jgi:hypothetical protein
MTGAKVLVAVVTVVCATACSAGTDKSSAPVTSSDQNSVKKETYLTELLPGGSMNFKPGVGVIGETSYPHSLLSSCGDWCLPVGQSGQQGQPGMEFKVPDGFNRFEFVAGLTDSSTETDRSVYVSVWKSAELLKLFESKDVTVGVVLPVSVSVSPGDTIRVDGGGLNGNETLCICDPKLVAAK